MTGRTTVPHRCFVQAGSSNSAGQGKQIFHGLYLRIWARTAGVTQLMFQSHIRIWRDNGAGPALLLSLISIGAYAGDPVELNEIVVSGARPAVERIGTVYEVDAEEIAQPGVRALDDAIELLPGVNIRTGGNGQLPQWLCPGKCFSRHRPRTWWPAR